MIRRMIQLALCMGGLALTTTAGAADVDDVKSATEGWLTDANTQNVASFVARYHPEETSYGGFGELLSDGAHTMEAMTGFYEAGFRTDLQWRHLDAKVIGNTGIATGYLTGAVTMPGEKKPVKDTWRTSVVWVRDGEAWKIVHFHASELLPEEDD